MAVHNGLKAHHTILHQRIVHVFSRRKLYYLGCHLHLFNLFETQSHHFLWIWPQPNMPEAVNVYSSRTPPLKNTNSSTGSWSCKLSQQAHELISNIRLRFLIHSIRFWLSSGFCCRWRDQRVRLAGGCHLKEERPLLMFAVCGINSKFRLTP